jgi:hypothetical protein
MEGEMKLMTIRDIYREFDKKAKRWREERKIGKIHHDVKDKYIIIDTPRGGEYDIALTRIKNGEEAFGWICHMTEKNWFTPKMTYDFIEVIKRVTNANEYCNPEMWEGTDKEAANE